MLRCGMTLAARLRSGWMFELVPVADLVLPVGSALMVAALYWLATEFLGRR